MESRRENLKILRPVIKYFSCPCPPGYKCQDQWICTKCAVAASGNARVVSVRAFHSVLREAHCAHSARGNIFFWIRTSFLPSNWDICEVLVTIFLIGFISLVIDHWVSGVGGKCSGNILPFAILRRDCSNFVIWLKALRSVLSHAWNGG